MKKILVFSVTMILISIYTFAQAQQAPPFTVAWKEGVILGLLVPAKTTKEQLKALVYKLRQAKKDNNLASLLPPINLGLKDKYAGFILLFFSDQKWSTIEEYKKYERANERTANGRAISKAYLNQIVASYSYEFVNGKEYGAIGYNDGADKSAQFKKLF